MIVLEGTTVQLMKFPLATVRITICGLFLRRREGMTDEQKSVLRQKTYQVPSSLPNLPLTAIFAAETPLGHWLRFPWGTSLLGVFRRP